MANIWKEKLIIHLTNTVVITVEEGASSWHKETAVEWLSPLGYHDLYELINKVLFKGFILTLIGCEMDF